MKLPAVFNQFVHKAPPAAERFLSLVLDVGFVEAAVWSVGESGKPTVEKSSSTKLSEDSWDGRIEAADQALSTLDDDGSVSQLHKVVLGLSPAFLTASGDMEAASRSQIKSLCKELELEPIGFVPLTAALVHHLKVDEGVPPTVLLLSLTDSQLVVSVYKVGSLVAQKTIGLDDVVADLEKTLKSFTELEVLPSRMLLYGPDEAALEEIKGKLLKHPWPTRANFMHFPKIELLQPKQAVAAVSLAGASELATEMGEEIKEEKEEPNVEVVTPEALGFKKEDVIEEPEVEGEKKEKKKMHFQMPVIPVGRIKEAFSSISFPTGIGPLVGIILLLILLIGLAFWFVPHAAVTVLEIAEKRTESATLTVDPTAAVADAATKTIPAKKQEKTVGGEKTLPVAGKKQVGDPAKGSVTVYNKVTSEKTFKKGTILTSGSLQFSLDDDIKVASASETIGSITFGKANGSVTAVAIGSQSNLPAGTEFTFKDTSSSVAIARNDAALTGGTSRDVTVVSRSDYDNFVKVMTAELVEKAKAELASGVTGREKLIDETVKTTVAEKTFSEELDQEAKELHGKLTITISGLSYSEDDVAAILADVVTSKLPAGYSIAPEQTTTTIEKATVKKDGTVVVTAKLVATALPAVDTKAIQKLLAGKTLDKAQESLRSITGVGGMEVNFRWWPWKGRFPINQNNISVSLAIQ